LFSKKRNPASVGLAGVAAKHARERIRSMEPFSGRREKEDGRY
jgi:hypothetical protein